MFRGDPAGLDDLQDRIDHYRWQFEGAGHIIVTCALKYYLVSFLYANLVGRSAASPRRRRLSSS